LQIKEGDNLSRNINEIIGSDYETYKTLADAIKSSIRVAIPGIIQSFDATTQTCTVQPCIREKVTNLDYSTDWTKLPLLLDVPIALPRAGNFALTLPVQKNDECLIIFSDMCIDGWWSLGGIQNQLEKRRHDLSDCFAILGTYSQPNKISNYSTDSAQLRNLSGTQYIGLSDNEVNIVGNLKINGEDYRAP
jgi:hypothetical protein